MRYDPVWVQYAKIGDTVVGKAGTPRSYLVQTTTTCLRKESTAYGADAERDSLTDANRESGH